MTTPLLELIRARAPLPADEYMDLALYHPEHGYYSRAVRAGWLGHFVTSPEITPAFGWMWARAVEETWEACGRPDRFVMTEIGPGEGGFAAAVWHSVSDELRDELHIVLVERTGAGRVRQEERLAGVPRVSWVGSLEAAEPAEAGFVFANEVLDNLPVKLVERRGELFEIWVAADGAGLHEELRPASPGVLRVVAEAGMDVPDGHRAEVPVAVGSFVARAAGLIGRGAVVFVDYGAEANDLVARPAGTLLCYSATGADDAWLDRPGEKDITAHANWTAVTAALTSAGAMPAGPIAQADALRELGLADVLEEAKARHDDAIAGGRGAEAVRALSERGALATLADSGGLGGLGVTSGFKGVPVPRWAGSGA